MNNDLLVRIRREANEAQIRDLLVSCIKNDYRNSSMLLDCLLGTAKTGMSKVAPPKPQLTAEELAQNKVRLFTAAGVTIPTILRLAEKAGFLPLGLINTVVDVARSTVGIAGEFLNLASEKPSEPQTLLVETSKSN